MQVRLYATLRALAGAARVEVPAAPGEPVGVVLRRLVAQCPGLEGHLLSPDGGALLPHVQVFIAGRSIRDLEGLATPISHGVDLAIFPPVAGG
ncbi:molybdopterin synthase sulfur carrier subunit [Symbiobacterium terraclitae]|uniref:Molybdopterin synthase sulfur carrier subunit n=1 Tax=Symbiobacterium terraclitae TaxID=557451 RepID=A0ABS4JV05_9FIRM|nr:molybdopterin synthase sulfur carrier subunit [Symbiobacterium terraclitae]